MVSKAQVQNANGPGMGRRGRHPVRGQRGCGDRRRSEQMQAGRSQDSLCSGHMQWVAQRPGSWTSPTSSCPFTPNRVCDARRCPGALLLRLPETKPSQLHWGPCPERPWIPGRGRRPGSATVSTHGTRRVHHSSTQLCSAASMFHATAQPTLQSGITVRSHTATQVAAAGPRGRPAPVLRGRAKRVGVLLPHLLRASPGPWDLSL